jgi:hypothetical protein
MLTVPTAVSASDCDRYAAKAQQWCLREFSGYGFGKRICAKAFKEAAVECRNEGGHAVLETACFLGPRNLANKWVMGPCQQYLFEVPMSDAADQLERACSSAEERAIPKIEKECKEIVAEAERKGVLRSVP